MPERETVSGDNAGSRQAPIPPTNVQTRNDSPPRGQAGTRPEPVAHIPVTITYLTQSSPPRLVLPPRPACQTAFLRARHIPLHFYRYLYREIGTPYFWASRRYMDDRALAAIIHHPDVHIYLFYKEGRPCGYGEIDARAATCAEIRFFGLFEEDIGQGLGKWFFVNLLKAGWQLHPQRIRIETCTKDHPAALRLYQKMGFTAYKRAPGVIRWNG